MYAQLIKICPPVQNLSDLWSNSLFLIFTRTFTPIVFLSINFEIIIVVMCDQIKFQITFFLFSDQWMGAFQGRLDNNHSNRILNVCFSPLHSKTEAMRYLSSYINLIHFLNTRTPKTQWFHFSFLKNEQHREVKPMR